MWPSNLIFCNQLFPAFFIVQVFQGPDFLESMFFRLHVFQGPGFSESGFSGSMFFQVQVFPGPGFSGPGPGSGSRF